MAKRPIPKGMYTMDAAAEYLAISRYWFGVLRNRGFFQSCTPSLGRVLFTRKQLDDGKREYEQTMHAPRQRRA